MVGRRSLGLVARVSLFLGLLGVLPACSTATAAGCGVGTLAGMALAGLAAASADDSVDTGQVVLGGAFFGVVSGCTGAAVTEAMLEPAAPAPPTKRAADDDWQLATPPPRLQETYDAQGQRHLKARFYDAHMTFVLESVPAKTPESTLEITSPAAVGAEPCNSVLVADGKTVDASLRGRSARGVRMVFDISVLQTLSSAKAVVGRTCGHEWRLSEPNRVLLRDYTDRFMQVVVLDTIKPAPVAAPAPATTPAATLDTAPEPEPALQPETAPPAAQ